MHVLFTAVECGNAPGALPGSEWYIYDVGGSRNNVCVYLLVPRFPLTALQRPMWIPYFDDVQAIIFLAPLAFNLMLEEDPKVNRLVRNLSRISRARRPQMARAYTHRH